MCIKIFQKCLAVIFTLYLLARPQIHAGTEDFLSTDSIPIEESPRSKSQCDLLVTFKAYYTKQQRQTFVKYAFLRIEKDGWRNDFWIVDRDNRAYNNYPSDFDIVRLNETNLEPSWYASNLKHPTFKSVRIDKKLQSCPENLRESKVNISESFMGGFGRSLLLDEPRFQKSQIAVSYLKEAVEVWKMGATGSGVSVAVFDTGLSWTPDLKYIKDVTQWTDDNTETDVVGHGSFVASVIASSDELCPGLAPDVELLIFKVFNRNKVSRTSWFLDAFNYAMFQKVDVINLSIGGPDFEDKLFVEKVSEIVASGIVFVSAIGNDGPIFGTLNNPGDQMDVIGVGAVDQTGNIAQFSSRGMTTWELPHGYGRVKPDVLALGVDVIGKSSKNVCVQMQGTSVASPIVTGAIALILSANQHRKKILNPAFVKQTLTSTAIRLPNASMFVQGSGKLDILKAFERSKTMQPHVTVFPTYVDAQSTQDSDYFWPYSSQPLYYGALPVKLNFTIVNSLSVTSQISSVPIWRPHLTEDDIIGLNFDYLPAFWPWSGYLGLKIWIKPEGANFSGKISGIVSFNISSYSDFEVSWKWISRQIKIPLSFHVVPTPRREHRVLWDVYHSLKYPNGYFPRDNLKNTRDLLDWYSDHPHTNFRSLYKYLRKMGVFIEVLSQSFGCFDAANYQALLIVDPEEEYHLSEIEKLKDDVRFKGLSILVVSDWWNAEIMEKIQYFDENTKTTKFPLTGGSNVPALNRLLDTFGISLSDHIYYGATVVGSKEVHFRSSSSIIRFPAEGFLVRVKLKDEALELLENKVRVVQEVPIAGILDLTRTPNPQHQLVNNVQGRIALLTDTSCIEDSKVEQESNCFSLFHDLLKFATLGDLKGLKGVLKESSLPAGRNPLYHSSLQNQLASYSKVVESYEPYSEKHHDEKCESIERYERSFVSQLLNANERSLVAKMLKDVRDLQIPFKNDAYDVEVSVSQIEINHNEGLGKKESPSAGVSYSAGLLPFMRKNVRPDYTRKIVQQEQPWTLLFFIIICGVFLILVLCDMFVRGKRKRFCRRINRIFR